jgi:hypothetical protein
MEINFTTTMSGGAKVVICKWGGHVRRPSGDWMSGHGPQCGVSAIILIGD